MADSNSQNHCVPITINLATKGTYNHFISNVIKPCDVIQGIVDALFALKDAISAQQTGEVVLVVPDEETREEFFNALHSTYRKKNVQLKHQGVSIETFTMIGLDTVMLNRIMSIYLRVFSDESQKDINEAKFETNILYNIENYEETILIDQKKQAMHIINIVPQHRLQLMNPKEENPTIVSIQLKQS
jgi:hypothetical protein